jgi:hypothetical protein
MARLELDNFDAARAVETMVALADLVDRPEGSNGYLSDAQVQSLTCPPGLAGSGDRSRIAANLRATAAAIAKQLPDDAPDVSGPYAFRVDATDILGR